MAVIKELIRKESDGTLSFGNYEFDTKQKLSDFEYEGDLYKVKTFNYSMELVMICIVVVIVLLNMLIFYYLTLLNLKLIFMLKTV